MNYRKLTVAEIAQLQTNRCLTTDWNEIEVVNDFQPSYVKDVSFSGHVCLGNFSKSFTLPGGVSVHSGIYKAHIHNSIIENDVYISDIHTYLANYRVAEGAFIQNVDCIMVDTESSFGNGVLVSVINEAGGRAIPIFDTLSSHLAYILALYRHATAVISTLQSRILHYTQQQKSSIGIIGKETTIINSGTLLNVRIGEFALLDGVSKLVNGSVNSTQIAPVTIGTDVICTDFIISSGVTIAGASTITRCFIGQACVIDKHYSAIDSLFFANCQGMHGEATAIFAGPYTVSHHKSTLLIAGLFSFMNAGSGSNQSNHLYKLGPVHQGITERGVKTASDSYLLWPAKIGAFTSVIGRHKTHADTSCFPFSYLIEDNQISYLFPGANLTTVGTIRDAHKWASRDNRLGSKIDQLNFELFNPYTLQQVILGIETLQSLQMEFGAMADEYSYQGCKIRYSGVIKGLELYHQALLMYLGNQLCNRLINSSLFSFSDVQQVLNPTSSTGFEPWCDLAGLLVPSSEIDNLLTAIVNDNLSLSDIQKRMETMHAYYDDYAWSWVYNQLGNVFGKSIQQLSVQELLTFVKNWKEVVAQYTQALLLDAQKEFSHHVQVGYGVDGNEMVRLADFEHVRGTIESDSFVCQMSAKMEFQLQLADNIIDKLSSLN